jgi:hypothetical protein
MMLGQSRNMFSCGPSSPVPLAATWALPLVSAPGAVSLSWPLGSAVPWRRFFAPAMVVYWTVIQGCKEFVSSRPNRLGVGTVSRLLAPGFGGTRIRAIRMTRNCESDGWIETGRAKCDMPCADLLQCRRWAKYSGMNERDGASSTGTGRAARWIVRGLGEDTG